jgi:hypothetical protein
MKKLSLLAIFWFVAAGSISTQRVTLDNPADLNTNYLFSQLVQYRNLSKVAGEFAATGNALVALFNILTPTIKGFANYTGVFTGNCSVFFEDTLETASCDFATANLPNVTLGGEITEKKRLPEAYWHQITLSNVLLASVFADWRRGKLQEFESDLYFKQGTCSGTASMTAYPTLSFTRTPTESLSKKTTPSLSSTIFTTLSINETSTQNQSQSVSASFSRSRNITNSYFDSFSKSFSESASSNNSLSGTETPSISFTDSETSHVSTTDSDILTKSPTNLGTSTLRNEIFVVVWNSNFAGYVLGQLYTSTGSLLGSGFQVSSNGLNTSPAVTGLSNGNFVVVWNSNFAGYVLGQLYTSTGSLLGSGFQVSSNGLNTSPAIAAIISN